MRPADSYVIAAEFSLINYLSYQTFFTLDA